jgi:hypothetical protein
MYIFAKNALPLPDSPADYQKDVAYRKTPSQDFVANGIKSNDFVETAQLNDYLFSLATLLENLLDMGIASPALFSEDSWQENDLKRDADGQTILIYKNSNFVRLDLEATETTNGFIDISKVFARENPFDLVPLSKHDVAGSVKVGNVVLQEDFLKLPNASTVQSNEAINDDNDMGETRYYSPSLDPIAPNVFGIRLRHLPRLNIVMFPARDTSKFYLKHIWCNPENTIIHINDVSYRPTNPDVIVLSDGTVFE